MRCRFYYRPGHPKASANGFVAAEDLYIEQTERAIDAPIMVDRWYEGARTIEGHDIGSRQKHRTYMKDRGLTTADDYDKPGGEWDRAAKERAQRQQGIFPDARERRQELGRIAYEVEKKNARRR